MDSAADFQAFGAVGAKVGVLEAIDRFNTLASRWVYRRILSLATSENSSMLMKPVIPIDPGYLVCGDTCGLFGTSLAKIFLHRQNFEGGSGGSEAKLERISNHSLG